MVDLSVRIVNVIATTRIKGSIDLKRLSQKLQHANYVPEVFCGLVYRRSNSPTNILFASGKISSHGAKTEKAARQSLLRILKKTKDFGCVLGSSQMEEIKIENIVGTADLGCKLDLESMAEHVPNTMYEPEQFPGLMYRPFDNSVVILTFATGKIVIVGARSKSQIRQAFEHTKNVVNTF